MKKTRAFTLGEALLSASLLAMIVGVASIIFSGYNRITRQSGPHEHAVNSGYLVLERISSELSEAIEVSVPASVTATTQLIFEKMDPSLNRLPLDPNALVAFEPKDPSQRCQITYQVTDQVLWRLAEGSTGYVHQQPLLEKVAGFSASAVSPMQIEFTLSLLEGEKVRLLRTKSFIWSKR